MAPFELTVPTVTSERSFNAAMKKILAATRFLAELLLRRSDTDFYPGMLTARWMALAFVIYGLTATAFLAINVPPFQVPDEPNHFMRAAQIADGKFLGSRLSATSAGGAVDPAIQAAFAPFKGLIFHPEERARRADWTPNIHWSDSRVLASFANTALYPPFFYAPSALGVMVGRKAQMNVLQTLELSRLLTGTTAVAIGALAIVIAEGAAPWIFAILTLPMSLWLMASASQDALLLSCSALAGALAVHVLRRPSTSEPRLLTILSATLFLIVIARPPYAALIVLPLAFTTVTWRLRLIATASVALCIGVWSIVLFASSWNNYFSSSTGSNAAAQFALLLSKPLFLGHVLATTLYKYWEGYITSFLGALGWQETLLPSAYYVAAKVMLGLAAAATMLGANGKRISVGSYLAVATAVILSALGIFATEYLIWTPVGSETVEGIQGRYFLPVALAAVALLPKFGGVLGACIHKLLTILVIAFPLVSLAVTMRIVVLRYYLA
jgi:uncharacterized membrane protein